MQFFQIATLLSLVGAPLVAAGRISARDAAVVLSARSGKDLEARACKYGNCDGCLTNYPVCKNADNKPDCLSCALACIGGCGQFGCC